MVNPETDEADFTEYKKRLEQCFRQYVEKSSAPDFVDTLSPEHLLAVLTGGGSGWLTASVLCSGRVFSIIWR